MAQIKNPVTIVQGGSPTPTPTVEEKDINFYDYDGTLVESWTLAELPNKTALPANPTHTGLTAQGWNWTLADLQSEGAKMNVGQMYMPTDGKTHIFVEVDAEHLTPNLAIGLNGTAIVDWGDDTATTTFTGSSIDTGQNAYHTYAAAGSYEVTIEIPEGSEGQIRGNTSNNYVSFLWKGADTQSALITKNKAYAAQVKKIYVGQRMNKVQTLNWFTKLEKITLHNQNQFVSGWATFQNCYSLKYVVIPNSITSIDTYIFASCYSLKSIAIPSSVTSLSTRAFRDGAALKSITIPSNVSNIDSDAFEGCSVLEAVSGLEGITSMNKIFRNCHNLSSFRVPASVTSISSDTFAVGMDSFYLLDCSDCTSIPTAGSNLFGSATDGLIIKVPVALEADWKATSGWSTYASYIVGV